MSRSNVNQQQTPSYGEGRIGKSFKFDAFQVRKTMSHKCRSREWE